MEVEFAAPAGTRMIVELAHGHPFSDKQCGGERGALKAAEAKLVEMKAFFDSAPKKNGKLTRPAEAGARKVLEAG